MYETFYGLSAKPFQLKPDPSFFFSSKGHQRAMAYLEYGLSQGEGFIIITGEVGAGKTTLMRNLFRNLETEKILAVQIVNTHLDSNDILIMVAAALGLPHVDMTKANLLLTLEKFLYQCDQQGKRVLLVVDEAQNLSAHTLEELRMLSNFQTDDKPLLQTFLLGQPEFRKTLLGNNLRQLRQRVIATYHLGPMDLLETKAYIEHRLRKVGWQNDPVIEEVAFNIIHEYTDGVPRKINSLCDRLLIMGSLEELHQLGEDELNDVINDFKQEFDFSAESFDETSQSTGEHTSQQMGRSSETDLREMDDRLVKMEKSVHSVLSLLKQVLSLSSIKK